MASAIGGWDGSGNMAKIPAGFFFLLKTIKLINIDERCQTES